MTRLGLLAGAALLVAACAGQREPEVLTISEVRVDTDLSAIGSAEAMGYWQNLSADLETAIAAEFAAQIDPAGKRILVDVDELTLANALTAGLTPQDATLAGRVTLENPNGTTAAAYDVTATSNDVRSYLPPGTTRVSPTSTEYYQAIVRAFARGTATTLNAGS